MWGQTEITVTQWLANEHLGPPEAWRRQSFQPLQAPEGARPPVNDRLRLPSFQNCETMGSCHLAELCFLSPKMRPRDCIREELTKHKNRKNKDLEEIEESLGVQRKGWARDNTTIANFFTFCPNVFSNRNKTKRPFESPKWCDQNSRSPVGQRLDRRRGHDPWEIPHRLHRDGHRRTSSR